MLSCSLAVRDFRGFVAGLNTDLTKYSVVEVSFPFSLGFGAATIDDAARGMFGSISVLIFSVFKGTVSPGST